MAVDPWGVLSICIKTIIWCVASIKLGEATDSLPFWQKAAIWALAVVAIHTAFRLVGWRDVHLTVRKVSSEEQAAQARFAEWQQSSDDKSTGQQNEKDKKEA